MTGLLHDLRLAIRQLRKSPGFTAAAVITLALGIGATIAVFSIIYGLLIRPLPYPDHGRLMMLFQSRTANDIETAENVSPTNFLDFRLRNRSFADLAAFCGFDYTLMRNGIPEALRGTAVSAGFFSVLSVRPILGRSFLLQEDNFNSPHVVILSHRVWAETFQSDSRIVGKQISLNEEPFYVVGVMPRDFRPPGDSAYSDMWIPLQQQIHPERMLWRDAPFLQVIGKLRDGVPLDQARADLNRIAAQLHLQYPAANPGSGVVIRPLQEDLVGGMRNSLLLSMGIVCFVLFVACANVAILMLARVSGRIRELAVRRALGAGAWQILNNILLECATLAFVSGLMGIVFALAGRTILLRMAPNNASFRLIEINIFTLAFAVAISLLAGCSFGVLPALAVLKSDIQTVLRAAGNAASLGVHGRRWRNTLIVSEISLTVVLLLGAGLLLHSLLILRRQPLGFRTDHVFVARIALPRTHYQNDEDVLRFFEKLDLHLRDLPDIGQVGLVDPLPLRGGQFGTHFTIPGRDAVAGDYETAALRFVDSGLLPTMNIPLLRGRNLADADDKRAEPAVMVSKSLAQEYWPGEDAIGKYITLMRDPPMRGRIVGVVGELRIAIDQEPEPTIYVSYKQMPFRSMVIVIVPRDTSGKVLEGVRRAVWAVDPTQPLSFAGTMESVVTDSLAPWRFALSTLGGLAGLALLLTVIGLFAVLSYLVRERTKEIGIRIAIGANRGNVMRLVLRESLRLSLFGIAIGLAGSLVLVRMVSSAEYATHPNDPAAFAIVAVCVATVALLAAYIPARRAAKVDPMEALRYE